jgi:hypothetical protein
MLGEGGVDGRGGGGVAAPVWAEVVVGSGAAGSGPRKRAGCWLWSTLGYWEKKNRRKEWKEIKIRKKKIYKKDLDFRYIPL